MTSSKFLWLFVCNLLWLASCGQNEPSRPASSPRPTTTVATPALPPEQPAAPQEYKNSESLSPATPNDPLDDLQREEAGDPNEDVLAAYLANEATHPGGSRRGDVFDFGPRQAATLNPNIVGLRSPIRSCSLKATEFITQAFGYIHAFEVIEAERSFRQAFALDENCIMALWGAAFAQTIFYSGNLYRASKFIALADALIQYKKLTLPPLEIDLVSSLKIFLLNPHQVESQKRFVGDWIRLMKTYPEESEMAALSGHLIWNYGLIEELGYTQEEVSEWIDKVITTNPRHPAHHHKIHLWNDQKNEIKAIESAKLIGPSMLNSAHLWHMGGHIYVALQSVYECDEQFSRAAYLDQTQSAAKLEFPHMIHNYSHNQDYWAVSLTSLGSFKKAFAVYEGLLRLPFDKHRNNPFLTENQYKSPFIMALNGLAYLMQSFDGGEHLLDLERRGLFKFDATKIRSQNTIARLYFDLAWAHLEKTDLDNSNENFIAYQEWLGELEALENVDTKGLKDALQLLMQWKVKGPQANIVDQWRVLQFNKASVFLLGTRLAGYYRQSGAHAQAEELVRGALTRPKPEVAELIELAHANLKLKNLSLAKEAFEKASALAAFLDTDSPYYKLGQEIASELNLSEKSDWRHPREPRVLALSLPDQFKGEHFQPPTAPDFMLQQSENTFGSLYAQLQQSVKGIVLVFVLGGSCTACNEQLRLLEKQKDIFKKAGYDIVAVSSDPLEDLANLPENLRPTYTVLSDPNLEAFKAYLAYDDFESVPLHGLFVIKKDYRIHFLDRGAMPFLETELLFQELNRYK